MEFFKHNNLYLVRLDHGEKIRTSLTKFLEQEKIFAGVFTGLGAVCQAEIAHYPLSEKKYNTKNFAGEYEVTNITGNVSKVEDKPFIHMHITLGDNEYRLFGGHLMECTASPTLEIYLTALLGGLTRKHDEFTGLKLLSFCDLP